MTPDPPTDAVPTAVQMAAPPALPEGNTFVSQRPRGLPVWGRIFGVAVAAGGVRAMFGAVWVNEQIGWLHHWCYLIAGCAVGVGMAMVVSPAATESLLEKEPPYIGPVVVRRLVAFAVYSGAAWGFVMWLAH